MWDAVYTTHLFRCHSNVKSQILARGRVSLSATASCRHGQRHKTVCLTCHMHTPAYYVLASTRAACGCKVQTHTCLIAQYAGVRQAHTDDINHVRFEARTCLIAQNILTARILSAYSAHMVATVHWRPLIRPGLSLRIIPSKPPRIRLLRGFLRTRMDMAPDMKVTATHTHAHSHTHTHRHIRVHNTGTAR